MKDIVSERENTKKNIKSKKRLSQKFKEYKNEFLKIVWPTKKELFKQTINVLIICAIFFLIIFSMDFIFNKAIEIFSKILG